VPKEFIDKVVEEKTRVQRKLARRAGYDMGEYIRIMKKEVEAFTKRSGFPVHNARMPGAAEADGRDGYAIPRPHKAAVAEKRKAYRP
jgi:hypothetical protein